MAYSFSGGISPKTDNKTLGLTSKPYAEPPQVAIPLYGGTPAVSVGDFVDIGTVIGSGQRLAHASVSGTVTAIENRTLPCGTECPFVVIKNDCRHTTVSTLDPVTKAVTELTAEEITSRLKRAGLVDSHSGRGVGDELESAIGKAKRVVINCTESQPWESTSYRVMTEQTEAVIKGIKLLIYTLGVPKADIVIEAKKEKLIARIEKHITDKSLIDIKQTVSKHPISVSSRLVFAVYGKRVPAGGSPLDVGYAVFTPETAANLYRVLSTGIPMIHKRVTVSGDGIKAPHNLIVPIGTAVSDIAAFCGGTKKRFKRIVKGGALMGGIVGDDAVVEKTDDSVLFLSGAGIKRTGCIRCGRCIDACPVGLTPSLLAAYGEKELYSEVISLGAEHCIGCGCCSYVCPSGIPISAIIKKSLTEGRKNDE